MSDNFYRDKTILVTGGTGFVGTNFVEELVRRGARVRVTVHHRPLRVTNGAVSTVAADLSRPEDCLAACDGVDYIVHAAGATSAAAVTSTNPMADITTNLVVTSRMLHAAWETNVERFLLLSSSTVYPAAERAVTEEEAWSAPPHPSYAGYGWLKRSLEKLAEFVASKSNVKIALVRPTAVYGRHDAFDPRTGHVIPALIRRALARENPFEVWGTGDEVRDFVHVSDVVEGSLLALEKHATCDAINIGCGKAATINDVVRLVLNATDHAAANVIFNAEKPTTIPFRMVDITKATAVLGFSPRISLAEGIADTVTWFKGNAQVSESAVAVL